MKEWENVMFLYKAFEALDKIWKKPPFCVEVGLIFIIFILTLPFQFISLMNQLKRG